MDDRLKRLLVLYGEEEDSGSQPDAEAAAELAMLRRMKETLDARPRRAPRAETLHAVHAAARAAAGGRSLAVDRGPRGRHRLRLLRPASYAATLVLALAGVLYVTGRLTPADPAAERDVASGQTDPGKAALIPEEPATSGEDAPVGNPALAPAFVTPPLPSTDRVESQSRPSESSRGVAGMPESAPLRERQETLRDFAITADARSAIFEIPAAERSRDVSDADLSWDHSDEMVSLFERVERLSRLSPTEDQWRSLPARRALAAPVGLAAPRYTSLPSGY